jgi:hypothetical protein
LNESVILYAVSSFFGGGEGGRVVPVAACLADGNLVNVNNGAMNQGSLRNAMATLFGIT